MFHANAWGYPHVAAMIGSKLVFTGPHLDPAAVCELFVTEQVTVSGGVPTVWMAMADKLEQDPPATPFAPTLRFICAGSAPSEALMRPSTPTASA
jgi:fatty-acyl-CoA synthase